MCIRAAGRSVMCGRVQYRPCIVPIYFGKIEAKLASTHGGMGNGFDSGVEADLLVRFLKLSIVCSKVELMEEGIMENGERGWCARSIV